MHMYMTEFWTRRAQSHKRFLPFSLSLSLLAFSSSFLPLGYPVYKIHRFQSDVNSELSAILATARGFTRIFFLLLLYFFFIDDFFNVIYPAQCIQLKHTIAESTIIGLIFIQF